MVSIATVALSCMPWLSWRILTNLSLCMKMVGLFLYTAQVMLI